MKEFLKIVFIYTGVQFWVTLIMVLLILGFIKLKEIL